MRRGTEATWQSPGGPREAQVALTRGRRPRERAHADAREGRHVAGRLAGGWPTGIVGSGNRGRAVTQLIYEGASLFNRVLSHYFLRVGLCSHTIFLLQVTWRHDVRWILIASFKTRRSHGPKSTGSLINSRALIPE